MSLLKESVEGGRGVRSTPSPPELVGGGPRERLNRDIGLKRKKPSYTGLVCLKGGVFLPRSTSYIYQESRPREMGNLLDLKKGVNPPSNGKRRQPRKGHLYGGNKMQPGPSRGAGSQKSLIKEVRRKRTRTTRAEGTKMLESRPTQDKSLADCSGQSGRKRFTSKCPGRAKSGPKLRPALSERTYG